MIVTPAVRSLVRACSAAAIGAFDGTAPQRVIAREWSDDSNTQWLMRAAQSPTEMGDAPAMVRTVVPDFVAALTAESAAARIFKESLQLTFDRAGQIAVPTITADANYAAFVGEGSPIPVVQGFVAPALLTPKKIAAVVLLTSEMVRSSNIEALMQDAMIRSTALTLDQVLLDDQPEDAVRPQGVRYGVAALTASSAPVALDALIGDVATLYEAIDTVTPRTPTFVVAPAKVLSVNLRTTKTLPGIVGSYALQGSHDVIAIASNALASVVGELPAISAKRGAVTVHASDMPLPLVANDGTVASPQYSSWQMDCVAVRVHWPVTWVLRTPNGVSWLTAENW